MARRASDCASPFATLPTRRDCECGGRARAGTAQDVGGDGDGNGQNAHRNRAAASFDGGEICAPHITRGPFEATEVPLAPLPEQHRIVKKIEALFAEARTARAALERAEPLLKKFRQAVLSAAVRGELTERNANDEPASVLVERIRNERRAKWENDLRAKGKDPTKAKFVEAEPPNTRELGELPEGWVSHCCHCEGRAMNYIAAISLVAQGIAAEQCSEQERLAITLFATLQQPCCQARDMAEPIRKPSNRAMR